MYFLNINKPKGMSSFDVVKTLRKKLSIKQIGHSGTLDPLASGVLQIGVGNATKLLSYLQSDKTYVVKIKFGYASTTFDAEGDIEFVKKPDFSKEKLMSVLKTFLGKTCQKPPVYSAVKKNGKKLCDIVRKDPELNIDIPIREIEIYSIELLAFCGDIAELELKVKKGTYIRSFADDLGKKLNCGAYVLELKRIQAGGFKISDSNCLDDEVYKKISPIDVLDYDKVELDDSQLKRILNGNYIQFEAFSKSGIILLTKNNKLVSVANLSDNLIKPKKVFREEIDEHFF